MKIRTRTQRMAELAWKSFSQRKRSAEYDSFARSFPALIHSAGLCQAVAFVQAKGKGSGPPSQLLEDVALCMEVGPVNGTPADAANDLIEKSRSASAPEYMRLTRAAILAAGFIKRYSEATEAAAATANALSEESPIA